MAGTPGRKLDLKARLGCIIFVMCSAGGGLTGVGRVYAQSLSWDTNPVNYTLSTHITAMGQQITGTTSVGLTRNNTSASCFSHGTGGEPRPLSFNGVDGNPSLTTEYEMQCGSHPRRRRYQLGGCNNVPAIGTASLSKRRLRPLTEQHA